MGSNCSPGRWVNALTEINTIYNVLFVWKNLIFKKYETTVIIINNVIKLDLNKKNKKNWKVMSNSWGRLELFLLLSANPSGAGRVRSSSGPCESLRMSGIGLKDATFGVGDEHGDNSALLAPDSNNVGLTLKLSIMYSLAVSGIPSWRLLSSVITIYF